MATMTTMWGPKMIAKLVSSSKIVVDGTYSHSQWGS